MHTLAAGVSYVDLDFLGTPRTIATAVLQGADGVVLVDPGPSTTLPTLERQLAAAGIRPGDLTAIWLTHIHLDHAGASGTLAMQNPRLRVYVHERGAGHMADPAKLLSSAARLYGDDMERLWGEMRPVPASSRRATWPPGRTARSTSARTSTSRSSRPSRLTTRRPARVRRWSTPSGIISSATCRSVSS